MELINRVRRRAPPAAPAGYALWLALTSTATALCISVLAGWQRGGWFSERIAWVAIGAVLVVSAHVLPALCRTAPAMVRVVGAGLWVVCMVTTCYGHATFFLLAQEHAGARRVAALPVVVVTAAQAISSPGPSTARGLAVIAKERADVTAALARANARRCIGDCLALRVTRVSLAAKLDALNVEADEAKRWQAAEDHTRQETERVSAARDALRDSVRDDPVTSRLAISLGVKAARVDLASGLVFAGVLEGVACLFWFLALGSSELARDPLREPIQDPVTDTSRDAASVPPEVASGDWPVVSLVTPGSSPVTASHAGVLPSQPAGTATAGQPATDLMKLAQAVQAGQVRATVADIRRYLGCSQARATALRRLLANANANAVKSISIANLANQRAAVVERIRSALDLLAEAEQLARAAHLGFPRLVIDNSYSRRGTPVVTGEYANRTDAEKAILHTIDTQGWSHLLSESGLRTFMDARAREQWNKQIAEGDVPDLTAANIEATFVQLYGARRDMFERGVLECFRRLSWDYKTNQPFRFGKRIIVRYLFNHGSPNHRVTDELDDLMRVFCVRQTRT